jgi:hypothetical protein
MDVDAAVREFTSGTITFDELKAQFEAATFTVWQPTEGDWGAVYARADEGIDNTDVPSILDKFTYAGSLSADQEAQLLEIYRRKIGGGDQPTEAPDAGATGD